MDAKARQDIILGLMSLPHKEGVNREDWKTVHPDLLLIAWSVVLVCRRRGLPILFTSIRRGRIAGVSISDTHAQGRAFDISVRGWSTDDIDEVLVEVNREHAKLRGAFKKGDLLTPRALIYEHRAGTGPEAPECGQGDLGEKTCKVDGQVVLDPLAAPYMKENEADPHLHGQCRP